MATTRANIRHWFQNPYRWADQEGDPTHMIVVCDAFDFEDYPVYVYPGTDIHEKVKEYDGKNMQILMEVYSYAVDLDEQMAVHRNFRYE